MVNKTGWSTIRKKCNIRNDTKLFNIHMKTKRILALYSGGLDSNVSVFWMKKLGFDVIPIFFETPFFSRHKVLKTAQANNLDIKVIDITESHLKMLTNPVYGYGKHFNPCIDCHGLMFRTLKEYLELYEADFVISGEVVNQRPMSQRYDSMNAVKKISTIGDLIVRPLCQKRLPDTLPIREGWVNKDDLLGISGRSRTEQLKIAEDFGLKDIPNSGGGCLLTDKSYSERLKDLIDHNQLNLQNIRFLKVGRHFWINDNLKLVISRHIDELDYLHTIIKDETVLKCLEVPGPLGILVTDEPIEADDLKKAAKLLLRYCPKANEDEIVNYGKQFNLDNTIST